MIKVNFLIWIWCSSIQHNKVYHSLMSLKNLTSPNYHESNILQWLGFFDDITWNLNWLYYHDEKSPGKQDDFHTFTWKLDLPLLSLAEIFSKIWEILWSDLKICTAFNIKSWNFRKNKVVLLMWITNLKCPYYHKLKFFLKKYGFDDTTWKSDMSLLSRATIVRKNNPGLMK